MNTEYEIRVLEIDKEKLIKNIDQELKVSVFMTSR